MKKEKEKKRDLFNEAKIEKKLKISFVIGLFLCLLFSIAMIFLSFGCSSQTDRKKSMLFVERKMQVKEGAAALMLRGELAEDSFHPVDIKINTEKYRNYGENQPTSPLVQPFSTFSIDVDRASYSNARRFLVKQGRLPDPDSIRIEEFINYFDYHYPNPVQKENEPFSLFVDMAKNPLYEGSQILRIGIQGKYVEPSNRPPVNLVFLVDVSGSMNGEDRIELLKKSLLLMVNELRSQDRISLITYAGNSLTLLDSVKGNEKGKIKTVIKELFTGGWTAGGSAILEAYALAEKNFIKGGINRILLASDGDFNVGIVDHDELISLVENKRKGGISLSVLGFGMGNYNDKTMEQLADKGNGNYFYIDNILEAKKVLVDELSATLETIASDVKIQVEFNPSVVKSYRLIGYENRKLDKKDFDDDKVDAGEIGAGHQVTALYEIVFNEESVAVEGRYASQQKRLSAALAEAENQAQEELGFFRLRYKLPGAQESSLIEKPLPLSDLINGFSQKKKDPAQADFYIAVAAAAFGQLLRESEFSKKYDYDQLIKVIAANLQNDRSGYRGELLQLVKLANQLKEDKKLTDEEIDSLSKKKNKKSKRIGDRKIEPILYEGLSEELLEGSQP